MWTGVVRPVIAGILLTLAVVLAPAAAAAGWARATFLDTDAVVSAASATLADPAVRSAVVDTVTDRATTALTEQLLSADPASGIVAALAAAVGLPEEGLGATARQGLESALRALSAPALAAVGSLVRDTTEQVVASDAFGTVWAGAWRGVHQQVVALVRHDPAAESGMVYLADGQLRLRLDTIVEQVSARLTSLGLPDITVNVQTTEVVLVKAPQLTEVVHAVRVFDTVGVWAIWVALAAAAAGVALAVRRSRALMWAGAGLAVWSVIWLIALRTAVTRVTEIDDPLLAPVATALAEHWRGTLTGILWGLVVAGLVAALVEPAIRAARRGRPAPAAPPGPTAH